MKIERPKKKDSKYRDKTLHTTVPKDESLIKYFKDTTLRKKRRDNALDPSLMFFVVLIVIFLVFYLIFSNLYFT
jgi:hypothetical protein